MNDAAPQMRVRFDVEFSNGRTGHKRLRERRPKKKMSPGPSRLARLLALAHHFDDMIREGVVRDQAEIALLMKVTRARVTHLMRLLSLAPSIQKGILLPEPGEAATANLSERGLRQIASEAEWARQRELLRNLTKSGARAG